jgi:hypothetical protein
MRSLEVGVGLSTLSTAHAAAHDALAQARRSHDGRPGLALVASTVEHPADAVYAALRTELPRTPIFGLTTSLGVLTSGGVVSGPGGVVAVMLLGSPDNRWSFAAGSASIDGGEAAAGISAGRQAARAVAETSGQSKAPAMLLLAASPGCEEEVLEGIAEVFPDVPVYGGSAADHAIAGGWQVYTDRGAQHSAVSLVGLFGEGRLGGAFLAPYESTARSALVTAARGRRLLELDHRPAATVLAEWIGDAVVHQAKTGGKVLAQTALSPLAIRQQAGGLSHCVLAHPFQIVQPQGAVDLFVRVREGDRLSLMRSSRSELTRALEELAQRALRAGGLLRHEVAGALLIYCAGCAGAVGAELDEGLRTHLGKVLGEVPILGLCTFGEQGFVPGLGNRHQNLSLGLVLFGA